ncbi:Uncharacterised protein [Mycobacteroides abscessus subsp. abscessus]|nr:Uncharacterised protein [Mycobacteroides abscessus subsp. abscessus]
MEGASITSVCPAIPLPRNPTFLQFSDTAGSNGTSCDVSTATATY